MKEFSYFTILSVFLVVLTSSSIVPSTALLDWDQVNSLIAIKDYKKLEVLIDKVINGRSTCPEKYAYLQCIVGKIRAQNFFEKPFQKQFDVNEDSQSLKREAQRLSREILEFEERNANLKKILVEETLRQEQLIEERRSNENKLNSVGEILQVVDFSNENVKEKLTKEDQKQLEKQQNILLEGAKQVQRRVNKIFENNQQINNLQRQNLELEEQARQIQDRINFNNQMVKQKKQNQKKEEKQLKQSQQKIRKIQEESIELQNKILQIIKVTKKEEQSNKQQIANRIRAIEILQRRIKELALQVQPLNKLFLKIQKSQYDCYKASVEVVRVNNKFIEKFDQLSFQRFLNPAMIIGAYETLSYLFKSTPVLTLEYVNIFTSQWIQTFGVPINELVVNPSCCNIEELLFLRGKILQIKGNEFKIQFQNGTTNTALFTACSRLYKTENADKIIFMANLSSNKLSIVTGVMY